MAVPFQVTPVTWALVLLTMFIDTPTSIRRFVPAVVWEIVRLPDPITFESDVVESTATWARSELAPTMREAKRRKDRRRSVRTLACTK